MTHKNNIIIILVLTMLMGLFTTVLADAGLLTTEVETYSFTGTVINKEEYTQLVYNTKNIVAIHKYIITVVDGSRVSHTFIMHQPVVGEGFVYIAVADGTEGEVKTR